MPENVKTVQDLHIIFERDKNSIYKRINEVDGKHDDNFKSLELLLKTFIESQKPITKTVESIDSELKNLNKNVTEVTQRVSTIEGKVASHDQYIEARNKSNTNIWIAIIGGITTLGSSALGLSQIFFK